MATVTVDLPAHNTWTEFGSPPSTLTGDHEALADGDDSTGFSLSATTTGFYVGATSSASGGGFANGFGLLALPAGATFVDARFVARMDVSSVGAVPPGSYAPGDINPTPARYPTLGIEYTATGSTLRRYSLDAPSSGTGRVEVVGAPIVHLMGGSDYVLAGIGTPDTGTFGLCPHVYIADPWWQLPTENHPVFVSYLAVRVTYTISGTYPLRRYPPVNNGGSGPTRHYPRAVNRRAGGTY